MSANEIANKLHAMVTFAPGVSTAAVDVLRTQGIDETEALSNRGVIRLGAGTYTVKLLTPVRGSADADGSDCICSTMTERGLRCRAFISPDGTHINVSQDTTAGVANDTGTCQIFVMRFPGNS